MKSADQQPLTAVPTASGTGVRFGNRSLPHRLKQLAEAPFRKALGQFQQHRDDLLVRSRHIPRRRTGQADHRTGLALAQSVFVHQLLRQPPPGGWPYNFFR